MCRHLFYFSIRVRRLCSSCIKYLLSIYYMPSRVNPKWVSYQEKETKERSHQEVFLPSSLTGRNVHPVGFKISSRYVDRRTIPTLVHRTFITPPFKKSYENAVNNTMAYFNEIETLFSYWKILPNVLGLSSQIRQWIYSTTLHMDYIEGDVIKTICFGI